jgi:hypothetical protein
MIDVILEDVASVVCSAISGLVLRASISLAPLPCQSLPVPLAVVFTDDAVGNSSSFEIGQAPFLVPLRDRLLVLLVFGAPTFDANVETAIRIAVGDPELIDRLEPVAPSTIFLARWGWSPLPGHVALLSIP